MASDKVVTYDEVRYFTLTEKEKELVMGEGRTLDEVELVLLWRALHLIETKGDLLNKWVLHLPACYAQILPSDVLEWLWRNDSVSVTPAALVAEDKLMWTGYLKLHAMHICRKRANLHGHTLMSDYVDKLWDRERYACLYNGTESFFATKKTRDGILHYNEEMSIVVSKLMLETDRYSMSNDPTSPAELRYMLRKWTEAPLLYQEGSKTLFSYALGLVEEFYHRVYGSHLRDLDYYQVAYREEWVPDTTYVPGQLRDALTGLMERECRTLGPNVTFIRNYYIIASEPLLQALHNKIAKDCIERSKASCTIQ